uniref:Ras-GEF domain-containing protein n=1 Tax=Macrostomum lignano TaxID=282301 RepID=A0A1I8JB65_9PLAT
MIRSESFTDVGDAESPEPVDRGARGHRRVQFVRMTSRSCEDVGAADAGNAASSCSKVHSEGVGSTGLVAAKPSIKDATAEEERKRAGLPGGCDVAITNTALYEDDGRDYTDPAQLNVLYPAERVDPALAPYLDMSRPAESLLLMTSSMVTSGVYADLSGTAAAAVVRHLPQLLARGLGSWPISGSTPCLGRCCSRSCIIFQFLDEPSKALDNKLVDLIAELLASQSARDLAVHLFYYDYVYLLENYDTQLLPGLYCRLQTIVFDEAGELRRFLFFRHNLLRCLVSLTVLSRRTTRERVKLLSVWIEVLFLLRNEFKDLFAYRSVLMALTSSQVLSLTHSGGYRWNRTTKLDLASSKSY